MFLVAAGPSDTRPNTERCLWLPAVQYTPAAVAALLHEEAHQVNPQHIWRAFLGRRHSIVTSWQGLDVYGVDFGGGQAPRYVDATMPSMDGCIHVMEAGPATHAGGDEGRRRWYDEPVCVSLHLAEIRRRYTSSRSV